jgi:hypothetical protein
MPGERIVISDVVPQVDCGRWQFEVEAWVDRHAAWLDEHDRKVAAGQSDLAGELAEGEALFGPGSVEEWREAADALAAGRPAATLGGSP